MPDIPILLVVIVLVALIFDYTNGAHDSANAIASVVSTKVLSPKAAVLMAGALNFVGAFLGTNVAETIGRGIVNPDMIMGCQTLLLAALAGAIAWNVFSLYIGLPSSSSHALIGGLMGAGVVYSGWGSLEYRSILEKVIIPLFLSPLAGFIMGYLFMLALAWITCRFRYTSTNAVFKKLQVIAAAFMALSHGMNDAQKTMGIIALALLIFRQIPTLYIPVWVKVACAAVIMLGTLNGGWKIIKTMGHKIFKMQPVHGFAAQSATAGVILSASLFGAPISTTQVISSSVLGVGSSRRFSAVRWGVAGNMVTAWFVTIPAAGLVGALAMFIFRVIGLT
ncbi:MAG: inorganic phosphate transporter [Smithellaceae bacterium]|nr:inorganic phosphate transporter [Syntrophaceae bacterium]MDD4240610.1 inorganic phosphate transporter [Smithellaceae bacterium]